MEGKNNDNKKGFRNFIGADPYMNSIKKQNGSASAAHQFKTRNAFKNCCSMAATGDESDESDPTPVEVKNKVHDIKSIELAKSALAIVGLYVVVTYLYKKFKK